MRVGDLIIARMSGPTHAYRLRAGRTLPPRQGLGGPEGQADDRPSTRSGIRMKRLAVHHGFGCLGHVVIVDLPRARPGCEAPRRHRRTGSASLPARLAADSSVSGVAVAL